MDEEPRVSRDDGPQSPQQDGAGTNVARHIALMRQKHELRRERDRLLVNLAGELGQSRMADVLGVGARDAARLIESARRRLEATLPGLFAEPGTEITVRRLRARQTAGNARADAAARAAQQGAPGERDGHRDPGQGPSRIIRGRSARKDLGSRWVDADAHYETLARQDSGS
jgi:RNA polymerase-binding transcription factor DksA